MFTGIIEEVGHIGQIGNGKLFVHAKTVLEDAKIGDSIATNGICLTISGLRNMGQDAGFFADVMPETIRRTSLDDLRRGSPVNLERALSVNGRLGGHFVTGHIDGTGRILSMREEGNAVLLKVLASRELLRGIVEKGSVALDGISLTVAAVSSSDFTASLIPHTRVVTNLGTKHTGDTINIETDILGKYVAKMLSEQNRDTLIDTDFLRANGF